MTSRSSSKAWNLIYQPRASSEGVVLGRLKWCHGFAIIYMAMTERRIGSGVTRGLIRAVLGSATVRLPMSHHVAPPPNGQERQVEVATEFTQISYRQHDWSIPLDNHLLLRGSGTGRWQKERWVVPYCLPGQGSLGCCSIIPFPSRSARNATSIGPRDLWPSVINMDGSKVHGT